MADEEAEFAFQYEWWRQRQNDRGFYDLVGSLDCSAVAIKGQQESGAASSARPEVLRIYGRTSTALKGIVEDGRTIHCPSYSGYIESTTGNQAEICLSFRPPKHFRAYTGRWQNHDDELRAALYVDGSPIPNEEICKFRSTTIHSIDSIGFKPSNILRLIPVNFCSHSTNGSRESSEGRPLRRPVLPRASNPMGVTRIIRCSKSIRKRRTSKAVNRHTVFVPSSRQSLYPGI